jgi:hypothetical protein
MAIDERARHRLYLKLEEILGPEEATILMEHLPPAGWGDIATKRDLELRLDATKHELIATFRQEFVRQTRTMIFAVIGAVASVGGLVVAAARLG